MRPSAMLLVASVLIGASGAGAAEAVDPSRVRISFDPVTRQPYCTVLSTDPRIMEPIVVDCPRDAPRPENDGTGYTPPDGSGRDGTGPVNPIGDGTAPSSPPPTPVVLAGVLSRAAPAYSVLRLANSGETAGLARIAIIDATSGQLLAYWLSADVPAHGAVQADVVNLLAAATYTSPGVALPAIVNLQISTNFRGTAQHLTGNASGVLANASACGAAVSASRARIGYVPPDTAAARSLVRIVNSGGTASSAALTLRHAATGAALGTWRSPAITAGGSLTVAASNLRAEAGVDAGVGAVAIEAEAMAEDLRLELAVADITASVVNDQTTACGF